MLWCGLGSMPQRVALKAMGPTGPRGISYTVKVPVLAGRFYGWTRSRPSRQQRACASICKAVYFRSRDHPALARPQDRKRHPLGRFGKTGQTEAWLNLKDFKLQRAGCLGLDHDARLFADAPIRLG